MRVAIDVTAALNQRAGIGRFVRELVRGLVRIDTETDYCLLHAKPDHGGPLDLPSAPNVSTRQLPLRQRWLDILWHRARLPAPADLLAGGADVFHAPNFVLPALACARGVVTVHDLAFRFHPECAVPSLRAYLESAVPRAVRRANLVLADSENTRQDIIALMNAPPNRVVVVPGAVDERFHRRPDEQEIHALRQRLGLEPGTPFILTVGTLEPRKNLVTLVDALAIAKARRDLPHKLVVVGGHGWLAGPILEHITASPIRGDVIFPGFVDDADLPTLYAAADIFAFPSLYEGFGLPVLEAMAIGTPVIASNTSSIPEVASDAAVLIAPRDTEAWASELARLAGDANTRADLIQRGRQQSRAYSWDDSARVLLDCYQRVATGL
jgi:glycosyltransferase involved in cell wall biosynthesis